MSAVPFAVICETSLIAAVCTSVDVPVCVLDDVHDAADSQIQLLLCWGSNAPLSNLAANDKHQITVWMTVHE